MFVLGARWLAVLFSRLTPPASSAHAGTAETAHRVEVLSSLRAFVAQLLLILQLWVWPIDGLPAVALFHQQIAITPVVAVDGAILTCINVVLTGGNACVRVGVVNEPAASGRALAGVNVAHKSCSTPSNDACVRVVRGATAIPVSVSRVDIGVIDPPRDRTPTSLSIVIGPARCSTVVPSVRIRPGRACARIRCVTPHAVHVGD